MKTARAVLVGAIAVFVGAAGRVDAADYYWNTTTPGIYSNTTSWSSGGPPTASDGALWSGYSGSTNETVVFNQNEAARYVFVYNGDHVTFNLNGFTWTTGGLIAQFGSGSPSFSSALLTGGGLWDNSINYAYIGIGPGRSDLTLDSGVTGRVYGAFIGDVGVSVPNASTLWVKSGGVFEVKNSDMIPLGNANNHAATVAGAGTIRPTTANPNQYVQLDTYGIIAPGDAGTGTLTMDNSLVYMRNGSTLAMEIGGLGAGQYDKLVLNKVSTYGYISFDAGAKIELNFLSSYTNGVYGDYFDLVVASTGEIVTNAGFPSLVYNLGSVTNYEARLELVTLNGTQDALRLFIVPEPVSVMLVGLGGLLLLARRR